MRSASVAGEDAEAAPVVSGSGGGLKAGLLERAGLLVDVLVGCSGGRVRSKQCAKAGLGSGLAWDGAKDNVEARAVSVAWTLSDDFSKSASSWISFRISWTSAWKYVCSAREAGGDAK